MRLAAEEGAALIVSLMMTTLLTAAGLVLSLASMTETRIGGTYGAGVQLLYAADAAVQHCIGELNALRSWSGVLDGTVRSAAADGPPGPRMLPDGTRLSLAGPDAAVGHSSSADVRWQLFISAPLSALAPGVGTVPDVYVAVWAGDDPHETDGDPRVDANGILLLVGRAWGRGGATRAVEAAIVAAAAPRSQGGGHIGIRVLSWREVP